MYSLEQSVHTICQSFGCFTKSSGMKIICCNSHTHNRKRKLKTVKLLQLNDKINKNKPRKSKYEISDIECGFFISISNNVGVGTNKSDRPVLITNVSFSHKHVLNKQNLISFKKASQICRIPIVACQEVIRTLTSCPLPTKTLWNYIHLFSRSRSHPLWWLTSV